MPNSTEKRKRKLPPGIIDIGEVTPYPIITSVYGPPELEEEMDPADPESFDTDANGDRDE